MPVHRVIHRADPFAASRAADEAGKKATRANPERTKYFAAREVQNRDGSFPFGEGFLYGPAAVGAPVQKGGGQPGEVAVFGNRGSKRQQQDSFGAVRFKAGLHEAAALVVADGVSAAGPLARPASQRATDVFLARVQQELKGAPPHEAQRHPYVERAMEKAALVANFEVVRQVLLDRKGDGRFDAADKAALKKLAGIDLPTGPLTEAQMKKLAPRLDEVVAQLDEEGRAALTTFAAAVVVDNDLYTFSSGDAVVSLFRPGEPKGQRFINVTHRDQEVVELFTQGGSDWKKRKDVYENVITDSFGDSAKLNGTIRRYANVLRPGDRVVVASDGIGPRDGGEGLHRKAIEKLLEGSASAKDAAKALVREQVKGVDPGEYQDNVGVAVLDVTGP